MCDGGFGNRLGALIPGLMIAREMKRRPIISWPVTKWCECKYSDIFEEDPRLNVDEKTIDELFEEKKDAHFLIHANISTDKKVKIEKEYNIHSPDALKYIEELKSVEGDIVFTNHIVPKIISEEIVIRTLRELKLKKSIINEVE